MEREKNVRKENDLPGKEGKTGKREKFFMNVVVNGVLALMLLGIFAVTLAPQISQAFNPESNGAYYRGNVSNKNISLMINVYWGTEYLDGMLKVLKDEGVKATFFVGGSWAAANDPYVLKMRDGGHELGNHGYYHKDHKQISETRNKEEIFITHKLIESIAGVSMNLFAPPSGSFNKTTVTVAGNLGYKTIMWSKDTIDWRDKDANLAYTRATKNLKNGDLILMHPMAHTLEALPKIIKTAKEQGFKVTTVTENIA